MERLLEKYQVRWLEEGRERGKEEGREEGREEGVLDVAKTMLQKQMDFNTIRECTGLTPEALQSLQSEVCA